MPVLAPPPPPPASVRPPTFYATFDSSQVRGYMPDVPVLLSAASFESLGRKRGHPGTLPLPRLPEHIRELAVDPGGFQAQVVYGGYRFTWDVYLDWLFRLGPRLKWAAFPDLPCERELAADAYEVRRRQEQTLAYADELWGAVYDDTGRLDDTEGFEYRVQFPWAWVATIQGRNLDEYVWMAERLAPLLAAQFSDAAIADPSGLGGFGDLEQDEHWQQAVTRSDNYLHYARVAIGSLCRREKVSEIVAIVQACHEVLPTEKFHLWGVKLAAVAGLRDAGLLPYVASLDSSAWNGRHKGHIDAFNAAAAELGYSHREYAIKEKLPEYLGKVERQLRAPHTPRLF